MPIINLVLVVSAVLLGSVAQLFLKFGVGKIGVINLSDQSFVSLIFKITTQPFILIGVSLYGISFFIWLIAISKVEISTAYPMLALGFIVNAIAAHYVLGEQMNILKIAGIFFIIIGTFLITRNIS